MEDNIVKLTCKELGITQKELAERIGVSEPTMNRWASKPREIPENGINHLNLLIENKKDKEIVSTLKTLANLIK